MNRHGNALTGEVRTFHTGVHRRVPAGRGIFEICEVLDICDMWPLAGWIALPGGAIWVGRSWLLAS